MDYKITPEQWAQYEEDGYFIAKDVVDSDAITQLHVKITAALNKGTEEMSDDLSFDNKRTDDKDPMGAAMYRKLMRLGRNDPEIWALYFRLDLHQASQGRRGHAMASGHWPMDSEPSPKEE